MPTVTRSLSAPRRNSKITTEENQTRRFDASVVDLSIIRSFEDKPLPNTPSITHRFRNTPSHNDFGTIPFNQDIVEDDWQRTPGFNPFYSGEISSGSGDELQFAQADGDSSFRSSMTRNTPPTGSRSATPTLMGKGKGRDPRPPPRPTHSICHGYVYRPSIRSSTL